MRLTLAAPLAVTAAAATVLLAGCATAPVETPAEAQARRAVSCEQEVGIARDTPEFRLCVLLQQTNDRLDAVERRLRFIEQDVRFGGPYYRYPYWW